MRSAIVTASYRGDLERCRLLCESIDRRVTGFTRHLILVEAGDLALFRQLAGSQREIVDERELLPRWLRPFPDPLSFGRRRLWLSAYGPPLRGWHVQQLRRLAIAATIEEEVMLSVDSDVVFLREFDVGSLSSDGKVRFFRRKGAVATIDPVARDEHREWSRRAGDLLGIAAPPWTDTAYITTLLAWRTDTVHDLKRRIEARTDKSWLVALAASRRLSECTIYGRFVDECEDRPDRHAPSDLELCQVYWNGGALGSRELEDFATGLEPHQVAAGIQSFTGTGPDLIRRAAGLA
nr:DUF6492 family protein [Aurantimonas marina]